MERRVSRHLKRFFISFLTGFVLCLSSFLLAYPSYPELNLSVITLSKLEALRSGLYVSIFFPLFGASLAWALPDLLALLYLHLKEGGE